MILVSLILYNLLRSDLHRAPLLLHPRLFELRRAMLGPHVLERQYVVGLPPVALDTRYPPARHLDMNIMYEVN